MYNIDENIVRAILKKQFVALVGKSCKRIELIRDNKELHPITQINLIKDLIRELDYEAMREIENNIDSFSKGVKINVSLNKPER